MKKIFTFMAIAAATLTANAQTVNSSKLLDNWSVGVNVGGYTPTTNAAFFGSVRPTVGLEIGKELTPVFGISGEVRGYINGTKLASVIRPDFAGAHGFHSTTAFDLGTVTMFAKVNLSNMISGYKGEPRFFEVVAKAGLGWGNYFYNVKDDYGTWTSKFGLDFNFNLGKAKAWQINIKPAIVYDMEAGQGDAELNRFNVNRSWIECAAGVTYKFMNSNGTHNFTLAKLYDQTEVDGLNARINDLRGQLSTKDGQLSQDQQTIRTLQQQLNDCRNQAPKTVTKSTNSMESVVTFGQGKTAIEKSQLPNVERIATYMKNHKNSKVVIKGYASPEGGADINAKIATARAEAVKSILVNKYKIAADRITAEGQGVGNMFSEADWNRVAISTLDDNK